MIFVLQVGLAELWQSWGVTPAAVTGHSLGEVAAAYVAGALELGDAVRIVWHRARLQDQLRGRGKMAAVGLSLEDSRIAINGLHDHIAVAAVNGPQSTVWSGEPRVLERALRSLDNRQVFHRALRGQVAFHSPQMESLREPLQAALRGMRPRATRVPFISTVTGQALSGEALTADYWSRNLREPVQFAAAAETMLATGIDVLVEIGPHPVLAEPINQVAQARGVEVISVPSLRRNEDGRSTLLAATGALFVRGVPIDWKPVEVVGSLVRLPSYAWQRERCWYEVSATVQAGTTIGRNQSAQAAVSPRSFDSWLIRSAWEPVETPSTGGSLAGSWLIAGADRTTLHRVSDLLSQRGATVTAAEFGVHFECRDAAHFTIDPSEPEHWRRMLRESDATGGALSRRHLSEYRSADQRRIIVDRIQAPLRTVARSGALHLVQALAHNGATTRLWILTRGAQSVLDGESCSVAAAPIWGFGRVIAREHPELRTDLSRS